MTVSVSAAAFVAAMACAVFCLWRGLSATKIGRVRLVPWTYIGLFGVVLAFMLLIHMLNLMGVDTSQGRRR